MTQRHAVQNGRIMFVTTNTKNRSPIFYELPHARVAVESIYQAQERFPFYLHGFVVMPDHCHFLLTIPEDGSISKTMQCYKRGVSFEINQGPIWQQRFDCRLLSIDSIISVIEYIHNNPVKAGLCDDPVDYLWSSASGKWDITPINEWGEFE